MSRDVSDLFEFARDLEARQLRERGMALAANAQDRAEPSWSDTAFDAIVTVARRQTNLHVDDIIKRVSQPAHHNAWGAVWMRAIKRGVIAATDQRRPSSDPKKHAHKYPVYRSLIVGNS